MTFVPEVAPMLGGGNYGAGNLAEGVPMMVAATLSAGAHPGSKLPGRHREDDVNVVVAPTLRSASDSPAAHGKVNGTDQAALVVARPLTAHPNGSRLDGESDQFVVAHPLTSALWSQVAGFSGQKTTVWVTYPHLSSPPSRKVTGS